MSRWALCRGTVTIWKAGSRVTLQDGWDLKVLHKGRKYQIFCDPGLLTAEAENELSIYGIFSEMTVEAPGLP